MDLLKMFKKKEVAPVKVEETQEQKNFRMHHEAVQNLQNLRNLLSYLTSKRSSREQRKMFMRDLISQNGFADDVIKDTIDFYKKQIKDK
jgi:hypothetical protein